MGRKKLSNEARTNLLVYRYGEEILNDLKRLVLDINYTLDDVGKKHGFSREYTRQIFEYVYGFKYTVIRNKKMDTRFEIAEKRRFEKLNPVYKLQNYKDGLVKKGAVAEKKVMDICNTLNYKVTPYKNKSIDLVINGYSVDVKSNYKFRTFDREHTTLYCNFNISKSQVNADFIICHTVPNNRFFIIPKSAFPKGKTIYISNERGKQYWQYLEAWNLLKIKEEITFSNSCQSACA
jgi:hypothetical protein